MSETSESREGQPREPQEIRADIEATREDLGDTVAALAEKADVKAQTKEKIRDVKGQAQQKVQDVRSQAQQSVSGVKRSLADKTGDLLGGAGQAAPDSVASAASRASRRARENPMVPAVAGAFAAGILIGRLSNR